MGIELIKLLSNHQPLSQHLFPGHCPNKIYARHKLPCWQVDLESLSAVIHVLHQQSPSQMVEDGDHCCFPSRHIQKDVHLVAHRVGEQFHLQEPGGHAVAVVRVAHQVGAVRAAVNNNCGGACWSPR